MMMQKSLAITVMIVSIISKIKTNKNSKGMGVQWRMKVLQTGLCRPNKSSTKLEETNG